MADRLKLNTDKLPLLIIKIINDIKERVLVRLKENIILNIYKFM